MEAAVKVKVVDKLPPTVGPCKTVLVVAEVMVELVVVTFVVVVLVLVTAKDPPRDEVRIIEASVRLP